MASFAAAVREDKPAPQPAPAPRPAPAPGAAFFAGRPKFLVVDTNALIKGMRLEALGEQAVTIPEVLDEVRDARTRAAVAALPFGLATREPADADCRAVGRFARATGDLSVLSATDLKLLALARTLEREAHGDAHLRALPAPPARRKAGAAGAKGSAAGKLPGWDVIADPESWAEIDALNEAAAAAAAGGAAEGEAAGRAEGSRISAPRPLEASGMGGGSFGAAPAGPAGPAESSGRGGAAASTEPAGAAPSSSGARPESARRGGAGGARTKAGAGAPAARVPEGIVGRGWTEEAPNAGEGQGAGDGGWEVARKSANARRHHMRKEVRRAGELEGRQLPDAPAPAPPPVPVLAAPAAGAARAGDAAACSDGGSDDGSDDDSASDAAADAAAVAEAEAAEAGLVAMPAGWESSVASLTSDFPMQNVLLQMGLRLLTPDGQRLKEVARFALKCHACGAVTRDAGRVFCPRCGNGATLRRVTVSVGPDGAEHFGEPRRFSLRGTRFPLGRPKGGRAGAAAAPLLREDQLLTGRFQQGGGAAGLGLGGRKAAAGAAGRDAFAAELGDDEAWFKRPGELGPGGAGGAGAAAALAAAQGRGRNPNEARRRRR